MQTMTDSGLCQRDDALARADIVPVRRLLDEKAPPAVLTSVLLCVSQLARMSPDFYDPIRQADALRHVRGCLWAHALC